MVSRIKDGRPHDLPPQLEQSLRRSLLDDRFVVVMTCGIAGSGKTTLAKFILHTHPTFTRLSIDEIIFTNHGLYGVDYPASSDPYETYQTEADVIYLESFKRLLEARGDIVLDRSFYAKSDRDEFRGMIENVGERCVLVYLRVKEGDKEKLWERICERGRGERDANSALEISRERFEAYWDGFEGPDEEEEEAVVVDVFRTARS